MKNRFFRTYLVAFLILDTSCIHTKSSETLQIENIETEIQNGETLHSGPFEIAGMVYMSSKWPLENFFNRIISGEFSDAFRDFDFDYQPTNTDNLAIKKIIAAGYVPAYVQLTNREVVPISYLLSSFSLANDDRKFQPIPTEQLPNKFQSFNTSAMAANVFNTGAVVLGVAALMAAVVVTASHSGGYYGGGLNFKTSDERIYNTTTKTSKIDYRDYLLDGGIIAGGSKVRGLIFFYVGDSTVDTGTLRLEFSPL